MDFGQRISQRAMGHPEELLKLYQENRREQDVMRAQILRLGAKPEPMS